MEKQYTVDQIENTNDKESVFRTVSGEIITVVPFGWYEDIYLVTVGQFPNYIVYNPNYVACNPNRGLGNKKILNVVSFLDNGKNRKLTSCEADRANRIGLYVSPSSVEREETKENPMPRKLLTWD